MPFIYELAFDGHSADADSYSDWEEDYNGGNSGPPPGTYPSSNWNLNLDDPATNQGANGNDGGAINIGSILQTSDDGGSTSDPLDVGGGNFDAGETCAIQIDDGNGGFNTLNATVDYYFTSNGVPSESFHPNADALGDLNTEASAEILELFPNIKVEGENGQFKAARPTLNSAEAMLLQ